MCFAPHDVHFFDISTSKSGPALRHLRSLTCKCASHRNGVHFFDISTSKSGPKLVCFVHFDFQMCFARHMDFHFFDIPTYKSGPIVRCFVQFVL